MQFPRQRETFVIHKFEAPLGIIHGVPPADIKEDWLAVVRKKQAAASSGIN